MFFKSSKFLNTVKNGDKDFASAMLRKDKTLINARSFAGDKKAIHIAAMNCDAAMIALLLDHGADPNEKMEVFPYYASISALLNTHGSVEDKAQCLKILIGKSAIFDIAPDSKDNIYKQITKSKGYALLPILIELGLDIKNQNFLNELLVQKVDSKIIFFCLEKGMPFNDPSRTSLDGVIVYPIHLAAQFGRLDILKALLDRGVSPNVYSRSPISGNLSDDTPVTRSLKEHTGESLKLLLEHKGSLKDALSELRRLRQRHEYLSLDRTDFYYPHAQVIEALIPEPKPTPPPPPIKPPTQYKKEAPRITLTPPVSKPEPPKPQMPEPQMPAPWTKIDSDSVASFQPMPALKRNITHIFNFATRERTTISQNLQTNAESTEITHFSHIEEKVIIEAVDQFEQLGGTVDRAELLQKKPKLKIELKA